MSSVQAPVPLPIDPTGPIKQAIGDSLKAGTSSVVDGIGSWVFSSLADLTGAVFGFIDNATKPDVTAGWFVGGPNSAGPYRAMATVAASIMCVLVFGGVLQGLVQADLGGMVRRMVVHLPVAVLGIVGTVVVTQVLIDLTDAVSSSLTSSVGADSQGFVTHLQTLASQTGSPGAPTIILGLLMLVAALVVFIELLVRSLLIYLIVALCPLAWAALVWPALQGALRKTLELLMAVILSKVVVALSLAVGAAAFTGTGIPGADGATSSAPSSVTEGLGVLALGVATLTLAAFSPFLVAKLLPFAEGAVVAQGTRGAPMRAAQQGFSMKYRMDAARRFGSGGFAGSPGDAGAPGGARFGVGTGGGPSIATLPAAGGPHAGAVGAGAPSGAAGGAAAVATSPVVLAANGARSAQERTATAASTATEQPTPANAGPAGPPTSPPQRPVHRRFEQQPPGGEPA